jgi:hypothetical protein
MASPKPLVHLFAGGAVFVAVVDLQRIFRLGFHSIATQSAPRDAVFRAERTACRFCPAKIGEDIVRERFEEFPE